MGQQSNEEGLDKTRWLRCYGVGYTLEIVRRWYWQDLLMDDQGVIFGSRNCGWTCKNKTK